jgi:hypothetical protein
MKLLALCSSTLNSRYCSCLEYVVVTIGFVVLSRLLENAVRPTISSQHPCLLQSELNWGGLHAIPLHSFWSFTTDAIRRKHDHRFLPFSKTIRAHCQSAGSSTTRRNPMLLFHVVVTAVVSAFTGKQTPYKNTKRCNFWCVLFRRGVLCMLLLPADRSIHPSIHTYINIHPLTAWIMPPTKAIPRVGGSVRSTHGIIEGMYGRSAGCVATSILIV